LVMFLRKLIVIPVQDASPTYQEIGIWLGGAFVIGLVYVLVRWADRQPNNQHE